MPFRQDFARLFGLDAAIAGVVFGLVAGTLMIAMLLSWHRRRAGKDPSRRSEARRVELAYLGVLSGVAVFLVVASLTANARESAGPKPALRVEVTGFQWCWRFDYAGQPVTVTARCQGGPVPTLVLPAGRPVRLDVTSADVIHAFWVPYLRYKTYAYPGHVNSFTVTLARPGRWQGRCAQICGLYHYQMDFWVQAVPPARFGRWLHAHRGVVTAGGGA